MTKQTQMAILKDYSEMISEFLKIAPENSMLSLIESDVLRLYEKSFKSAFRDDDGYSFGETRIALLRQESIRRRKEESISAFCFLFAVIPEIIALNEKANPTREQREKLKKLVQSVSAFSRDDPYGPDEPRVTIEEIIARYEKTESVAENSQHPKVNTPKKDKESAAGSSESPARRVIPIRPQDFLVKTTTFRCFAAKHDTEDILARVKVLLSNGATRMVNIPAMHCHTCGTFYIMEAQYKRLKAIGIPTCKVITETVFVRTKNGEVRLNAESALHAYGYNVGSREELSDAQRQNLLASIIEAGQLSRTEIISHLSHLLAYNGKKQANEAATAKWKADLDFVSGLELNSEAVPVKSITEKRYTETKGNE